MDERLRFKLAITGFMALVFLISPLAPAMFGYLGHAISYSKVETPLMQTVVEEGTLSCGAAVSEIGAFGFIGFLTLPGICLDMDSLIRPLCAILGNWAYIGSASCFALAGWVYTRPEKG